MKACSSILVAIALLSPLFHPANAAEPKKLLVVTTTTGFRHTSIPNLEKVLTQLGKDRGAFTVELVQQPPDQPTALRGNATDEQKAAFNAAQAKWNAALKDALQKLSPESLKNYDGVAFVSTTGELPIPDPQGLLDWIKAGHAFIGIHAASDTFHRWPAYIDMLGGEFDHHGAQLSVDCLNEDPQHPATASLGKTWTLTQEEMYQFKNYDPAKVHDLLILDKKPERPFTPGRFPVSWCKIYGKTRLAPAAHGAELLVRRKSSYPGGRVFYTSLGHREDIIDADPNLAHRVNSVEISKAYDAHILGGIEWALGLKTSKSVP
ncbi:MAG: ThuA domain-containing protein [Verrucomicrobiota bacterium]|jgi:type 1 glutamine amidotransferase